MFEKGKLMGPGDARTVSKPASRRGLVVPHRLPWGKRLLASLVYGLIRFVSATSRYRYVGRPAVFEEEFPGQAIYCVWHNRLALVLPIYRDKVQKAHPERRMAAIVSASRDGAVVAHILDLFGVEPVRGSSSRRGPQALLELTTWAERGHDLAITPDGPRGPCYVVQEGAIALGCLTGLPIVPASYHASWKIRAKSWDRFLIPLPFGRITVHVGEPVRVPREASEEERERYRLLLQDRLRAATQD